MAGQVRWASYWGRRWLSDRYSVATVVSRWKREKAPEELPLANLIGAASAGCDSAFERASLRARGSEGSGWGGDAGGRRST